jgi:all-trans-retinol 13,14-reductase
VNNSYDYVIIGAGIGGLFTGALLARHGAKVCVLEQHLAPGGYGHSFTRGDYTFCTELHYIWNCGKQEDGEYVLKRLGLENDITFTPLDPEGFDHLYFPGFSYKIVKGFKRNLEFLSKIYPSHRDALSRYFNLVQVLHDEMKQLPISVSFSKLLPHAFRFQHVLRYHKWTTQDLFDRLQLPIELQSILAGQSGNLLAPPERASLLIHAAMVTGLDRSACVPTKSYKHLFESLVKTIESRQNGQVKFARRVVEMKAEHGQIVRVTDEDKNNYFADRYIYNGDPKLLPSLLAGVRFPRSFSKKLSYNYSPSAFTIYLGLKDLDLREFGFGNWNVWHYSDRDVNQAFQRQLVEKKFDDPSLFISTPTLHREIKNLVPKDRHQMVICTMCDYACMKDYKEKGKTIYLAEKNRITQRVLDQVQKHYIPDFRKHIDLLIAGTPLTMERFVLAPEGNSYGADLTPLNINLGKIDCHSPYANLFLVGATAGAPSFAGGIHFSALLFEMLTGEKILPARHVS